MIVRWEAVPPDALYAPVRGWLPAPPAAIADIGAGTGRDAAWFARAGHTVLAVEPDADLRVAGARLHPETGVRWPNDRLPRLAAIDDARFDLIVAAGVWHRLHAADRPAGYARLRTLLAPGGRLILSLRHDPQAPSLDAMREVALAALAGLRLIAKEAADSVQSGNRAAGVCWTWLVLEIA